MSALLMLLVPLQTKPAPPVAKPPVAPPVSVEGLPIGAIPRQAMPTTGCAAFLWSIGSTRALIAMAGADPAQVRLSLDGKITDLPRISQEGAGGFGFAARTDYAAGDVTAILDMTIVTRADIKDGAAVSEATLRIDRAGQDSIVLPVAGLIGCVV